MNEFQLIEKYFLKDGDDAALISTEPGFEMVIAVDTLVENRHFFANDMPANIAHKALAVNLSDMAAMGAQPTGFLLALTLPEAEERWLENFAKGLNDLAQQHNVSLMGGDTTKGPLTISITALGQVPQGQALTRAGAKPGDSIFVSGQLGAAAMVVKQRRHEMNVPGPELEEVYDCYHKPMPQIELGLKLRGIATSCIDISDGLAQDCKHILKSSNVGARINIESLPIHPAVKRSLSEEQAQKLALSGGDEYQLLFTAPDDAVKNISGITKIGQITPGHELTLSLHGDIADWDLEGWDHFS